MSNPSWALMAGLILIAMMLAGRLVSRLPLSGAMIYLGLGLLLGPFGLSVIDLHPIDDAATLELLTEIALLISLFSVGLRLEVPIMDARWIAPYRLAFASMAITVALLAAIGVYGMGMPLGLGVLLGGYWRLPTRYWRRPSRRNPVAATIQPASAWRARAL